MNQTTGKNDVDLKDHVPFKSKLAIGVGGLTQFFGNTFLNNFAFPVYNMTLGLNPGLLGFAMFIPRLWDAFTDPLMGRISDNTHSRFGRRRPYIVGGAVFAGIMFGLVWMVPQHWSETAMVTWLIITSLLYYTGVTVFCVPLNSLTYEMTPDYNERTRVMGFFTFFWKVGESINHYIFPLGLALAKIALVSSPIVGIHCVGWGVGLFIFGLVGVIPGVFVKERYYKKASVQDRVKIFPSIGDSLKNRAFVILIVLNVMQSICAIFASSLDQYLIVYDMFQGDTQTGMIWKANLSLGYAVVGFISIPLLTMLSSRHSKRQALTAVYVLFALSGIVKWFVFTPGNPLKIMLDPIIGAPIWIGIAMILPSMMADVCDEDELRHYKRREGMFGAMYSWVQKMGFSLAFLGAGVALNIVGFDEQLGGNQSPKTILGIRIIFVGGVILTALLALLILQFYPISPKRALETRKQLEARRGKV